MYTLYAEHKNKYHVWPNNKDSFVCIKATYSNIYENKKVKATLYANCTDVLLI